MKTRFTLLSVPLALLGLLTSVRAQFSSGSDGTYGPLNVTNATSVQLPPNGVLNCTTVNVGASGSLSFIKNALNTPVYILATGDVSIAGQIYVNGKDGLSTGLAGDGGPGGFAGGSGATASGDGAGAGLGPGGGKAGTGTNTSGGAGDGSYGTVGSNLGLNGVTYGSRLLIPMIGGSGGGGTTTTPYYGGGGGGGAISIASSTKIIFTQGAYIFGAGGNSNFNGGSGGAIRLVAPSVTGSANGNPYQGISTLHVVGGSGGGAGRTRIDTLDHSNLSITGVQSIGNVMVVFPNPLPKLSITNAAGTAIAEGAVNPVTVFLPSGTSATQQIAIRARDFGGPVPIRVALIPETGDPTYTDATIDNTTNNPADAAVSVTVPVNVQVHVEVYTR